MFYQSVKDTKSVSVSKEPLKEKVVRGGIWVFALRIVVRLLRLVCIIVLARLLAPSDFGLFGIALLATSALEAFTRTGFNAALVQKKNDITSHLDIAWTVQVIRGGVLALAVFFIAPYVAVFFDAPEAKSILQVIASSVLLQGFTNIRVVYFQKELEFHKQFIYQLSGTLANTGVTVLAAFLLRNVWALVLGLLAGNVVQTSLSYFIHPYRPRLRVNKQQFIELLGFGKWILGSSILIFLITQGDDVFVGKLLGVTSLGFYQLAYRLSNMPTTEITHVISQVTFPAYSKLQGNIPRLREAYLKVLQITAFISFPIAGLIFILAPDFTRIFLGQKWMPMIPAAQALVLAGLVRSIAATTGPIFLAVGKPRIETLWQVVRLMVLCVLIYPLSLRWKIQGVSVAVFSSILVSTIGFIWMVSRITRCEMQEITKAIAFPSIGMVLTVLSVLALKAGYSTIGLQRFFILAGVGCLTYLSVIYLSDRLMNYGIWQIIKDSV